MSKLKGLKKVSEEKAELKTADIPKVENKSTVEEKKPTAKLKNLKETPVAESGDQSKETKKKSNDTFTEEEYLKILSDGNFHKIRDLLDHFGLPHSSGGRERFRRANAKIITAGTHDVVSEMIDGAKSFKLIKKEKTEEVKK
jgi:hypothetical protein